MKITAINGSPKGKASNTNVMVSSFLKGAKAAGAETVNIFLSEKDIHHCRGCFSCWVNHPGQCVIKDDMSKVLALCANSDILILATPLYFDNISGMLKDFMDRLIVNGDPHFQKDSNGECRHTHLFKQKTPKLILMSNCGFSERSHFQVISHWIQRAALNMHTEVIGEIYAPQGELLKITSGELSTIIQQYVHHLEIAGKEIVTHMKISADTAKQLEQNFIPDEIYVQQANQYFDNMLAKQPIL